MMLWVTTRKEKRRGKKGDKYIYDNNVEVMLDAGAVDYRGFNFTAKVFAKFPLDQAAEGL